MNPGGPQVCKGLAFIIPEWRGSCFCLERGKEDCSSRRERYWGCPLPGPQILEPAGYGCGGAALRMRLQPQTHSSGWPQTAHKPPAPPGLRVIPSAILFTVALARNRAPSSTGRGVHFQPLQCWAAPLLCAPLGRAGDVKGHEMGC